MLEYDYEELDEVLHARIRLAIMAYLIGAGDADFVSIKTAIGASDGNLASHSKKLEEAGYIRTEKSFVDKKPCTRFSLTEKGRLAFTKYVETLGRFTSQGKKEEGSQ